MSDWGVGEEVPDGGLPRLLWGEEAGPSLLPPPPAPFQRLSRDPSFHRGDLSSALLSPALSLLAVASLSLGLSLLFQEAEAQGKAGGCQLLVRSPGWPSCESWTVSHLGARQGCRKGPEPGLAMPAAEAACT